MRLLPAVLLLTSLSFDLSAQAPKDATAPKAATASAAADRYKELADKQSERVKALPRGDNTARAEMMKARMADLQEFTKQFAKTPEANKARLEIASLAMANKNDEAMGTAMKEALAGYDATQGDLRSAMSAMIMANTAGLA